MKAIVGTHHYTDNNGHTYFGSIVGAAAHNLVWFLPLCDDGITWMKEPVCVAGVVANIQGAWASIQPVMAELETLESSNKKGTKK